jgi:hypothetical protein
MSRPSVTEIRSLGVAKINRLVCAARHLDDLRPAFAEWQAGEIYICKKTGSYRYRFGEKSKSPALWSKLAEQLFDGPAAFALAALVLAPAQVERAAEKPAPVAEAGRPNIIALASAA